MIPTIETIVEDLALGDISKSQAIAWLNLHAEGAANELRDHFAAEAMSASYNSLINTFEKDGYPVDWRHGVALDAYLMADAMLKARQS
jgi:hypothetical protein